MDAPTEADETVSFFLSQRPRLFRIACRVTRGDVSSAEDVVQEAWLRWQRTDKAGIRNPEAFLTTTATRLAINVVRSAPRRHEIPTDEPADAPSGATRGGSRAVVADPFERTERSRAVAQAVAVLLRRLTPAELAAYVLRGLFDYPYADVSRLLRTSPVNARQLVSRARARLASGVERTDVDPWAWRRLAVALLAASRAGELDVLERLLVAEVRPRVRDGAGIRWDGATVPPSPGPGRGADPAAAPGRSRARRQRRDRRPDG